MDPVLQVKVRVPESHRCNPECSFLCAFTTRVQAHIYCEPCSLNTGLLENFLEDPIKET